MKKIYTAALFILIGAVAHPLKTQAQDLEELLKGSVADANTLVGGYVSPIMKGIGVGLNQGWYNTAKPHKTLGFDLTVTASLIYIPTKEQFYTVNNNQLQQVKLASFDGQPVSPTGSSSVPTIVGPDKSPSYQIPTGSIPGPTFDGPPGIDLKESIGINAFPLPMYHLGIGLPKGFEVKIRFMPTINTGDLDFSMFGIGVLHDVKQYIPGIKEAPFDLSAFIGFTKMKADLDISGTSAGENQRGIVEFNSTSIQGLISKKLSVLTFYGGLGYNIAKSTIDVKGTYDLDDDGNVDSTDPVALNFSANGFRGTLGMRLKLAVFTFHGDYTLAEFNSLNVGFGISVR